MDVLGMMNQLERQREIVQEALARINDAIAALDAIPNVLADAQVALGGEVVMLSHVAAAPKPKRTMSDEGRKKISLAAKRMWRKRRNG